MYGEWYYAYNSVMDTWLDVFYCETCFTRENDLDNIVRLVTERKRVPDKCEGCGVEILGLERERED